MSWKGNATLLAMMVTMLPMAAVAEEMVVNLRLTDKNGVGPSVGTVKLEDTRYGLLLTPDLKGLPPGDHGFHVHVNPACGPGKKGDQVVPGLAAGGHFDPFQTGKHLGPYDWGHLGDLPKLHVDLDGRAQVPVLAPRLWVAGVSKRSLMVHLHGDNFSDTPKALGGGGPRLACGVIE